MLVSSSIWLLFGGSGSNKGIGIGVAVANENLCCLCDECYRPVAGRGNHYLTQNGDTCNTMYLQMTDPTNDSRPGTSECSRLQNMYRRTCCDSSFSPQTLAQNEQATEAQIYAQKYSVGDEPHCDLCEDGSYPGTPNTVTAVLYMPGNPTCKDLYWMGRRGRILDRLCNPLVDFFEKPCGCGKSTNGNQPPPQQQQSSGGGSSSSSNAVDKTTKTTTSTSSSTTRVYSGSGFGSGSTIVIGTANGPP